MVISRRTRILAGAGLAAAALLYWATREASTPAAVEPLPGRARSGGPAEAEGALPRVGLDRVDRMAGLPTAEGTRDVFAFGPDPQALIEAQRLQEQQQAAAAVPVEPTPTPVPTPTPLPPLNVKYIGSLESKPGIKVAFFMTEKKEVLSGQAGDTVMNRFRVVRIGIESVDVQQVGADQVQRLPLKGN
jgi:hypothetical protein